VIINVGIRVTFCENRKTKKDAEEVASELETIGDKLSTNAEDNLDKTLGNMSEKDYYNTLGDAEKREYLTYYQSLVKQQLAANRQAMMDVINSTGIDSETKRLNAKTVAKSKGYEVLDERFSNLTTTQTTTLRSIMDTIIDSSTDADLLKFANSAESVAESLQKLADVKTEDGSLAAEVLQDEDATLKERTLAFKELKESLGEMSAEFEAISTAYSEFNIFAE
jgi:predicted nucleic acid-binding OB-fold protein